MRRRAFLSGLLARRRVNGPAELARAAQAARPGDEIVLAAGEWRDADLVIGARGTAEAPVLVTAEQPGAVILTGNSRLRLGGVHTRVSGLWFRRCTTPGDLMWFRLAPDQPAFDCQLLDCAFLDNEPADLQRNTRWIGLYGARNQVRGCYLAGKRNLGTTLVVWLDGEPNHHRIAGNWFGPRPLLGTNGGETIRVGDSSTSLQDSLTLVEGNYFERCNGEIEAISNKSCGNIYRGNWFERCDATLTLRHGNRCRVEGNRFTGGGSRLAGGIRIIGEGHTVVNNLLEDCGGAGFRAAIAVVNGLPATPLNGYARVRGALIAHNTIVDCAEAITVGTNGGNAKLVEAPEGVRVIANRIATRAEFQSDAAGVKRAPTRLAEVTEDIDGQPRPDRPAEGCDEPSSAPVQRRLASRDTVGPAWWRARA